MSLWSAKGTDGEKEHILQKNIIPYTSDQKRLSFEMLNLKYFYKIIKLKSILTLSDIHCLR